MATRFHSMDKPGAISAEASISHVQRLMTSNAGLSLEGGAKVQAYMHTCFSADAVPACEDHFLSYRLTGNPKISRKISGKWESARATHSSVNVIPAHRTTSWRVDGQGSVLHIYFPPSLLRQAAGEELAPGAEFAVFEHLGVRDSRLAALGDRLVREIKSQEVGFALYTEAIIAQIAVSILRDHSPGLTGAADRNRFDSRIERRLVEYVDARRAEKISLGDLAAITGLGTSQFHQYFKATFGLPPYEYVIRSRVNFAKQLLAKSDLPLAEVALEAGFAHQAHLTRTFKRVCGATPQVYRSMVLGA